MALEDHLASGENVLARHEDFYATDRRLIKYTKSLFGEELVDLGYAHLSSLILETRSRTWLIVLGLLLVVAGVVTGRLLRDDLYLLVPVGVVLVVLGFLFRKTSLEVISPGMEEKVRSALRFSSPWSESVRELMKTVNLQRAAYIRVEKG